MGTPDTEVAANLAALRGQRDMTVRDLSARMTDVGHPLLPSGVTKIESGSRRVDAGDLVALAVALGVNPNRLLLPAQNLRAETIDLTPATRASGMDAWLWANGVYPLGDQDLFDFEYHVLPPELRLREQHTAMRAARDVVARVDRLLAAADDPATQSVRAKGVKRALERLAAEVNDLIASVDEQEATG